MTQDVPGTFPRPQLHAVRQRAATGGDELESGSAPPPVPYGYARTRTERDTTVVELVGEIDIAAAGQVTAHLDAAVDAGRPRVVVDLRAVTFIDCSGLGLLVHARNQALLHGSRLSLEYTDPRIRRTLRLAGLARAFPSSTALRPGA